MSRKLWTPGELRELREMFPHMRSEDIARHLGRSVESIRGKATNLGLKKSQEFMQSELSGRASKGKSITGSETTRFKPGQKGWNCGTKGRTSRNRTSFAKGNKPHNSLKDGAITVRRDIKTGRPYYWIRLEENKWIHLHRHIWALAHGEIPSGRVIRFRDGNSMNCTIENLEMVGMEENMLHNTIMRYPAELRQVMRMLGKLKSKIYAKEQN